MAKGKKYDNSRWANPSKRAAGYAVERKHGRHLIGSKNGQNLTDYEAGVRSGYLQAQHDHAGMFKFKKALGEGKTPEEAFAYSKRKMRKGKSAERRGF